MKGQGLRNGQGLRRLAATIALVLTPTLTLTPWSGSRAQSRDWPAGLWQTQGPWGSVYHIRLRKEGTASNDYGDGLAGVWREEDGNLRILWADGSEDFLFNGVMGRQRLAKPLAGIREGYSSFMKRVEEAEKPSP